MVAAINKITRVLNKGSTNSKEWNHRYGSKENKTFHKTKGKLNEITLFRGHPDVRMKGETCLRKGQTQTERRLGRSQRRVTQGPNGTRD